MTSEQKEDKEAGNYYKVLLENTLSHSHIKFVQDCIGGIIWVESEGHYPITPNDLKKVIDGYKSKEE